VPRDLPVKGRELNGVHFAMDFLTQQNKRDAGDLLSLDSEISANGKNVVVIGGGDTGSDCVGTSNRQGAKSIVQLEVLPKPSETRLTDNPWPYWPDILRTSSSHEEGCERHWSILTKEFIGDGNGNLKAIKVVDIEWKQPEPGKRANFVEKKKTEREIPCELALLAVGFVHPQHEGMLEQFNVELDGQGNVRSNNYRTNINKIFSAGDMRRGQSLVVWAISEGREAARAVDVYLMGDTMLPSRDLSGVLV
jgi:glutamate synthase (NADPH) small chain